MQGLHSVHTLADRRANRDTSGVEAIEAMNIHPEIIRVHPLAVERINPADLAEEVAGGVGVELIFSQALRAGQQRELALMHFDHQRILAGTDRTIASRDFGEIRGDGKAHCAAVAGAGMAHLAAGHRNSLNASRLGTRLPGDPSSRVRASRHGALANEIASPLLVKI